MRSFALKGELLHEVTFISDEKRSFARKSDSITIFFILISIP